MTRAATRLRAAAVEPHRLTQPQQGEQAVMATATTAQRIRPGRIRPGRTAHRAWFAALSDDERATVRANVQSFIDEGVEQRDAWDKVYASDLDVNGGALPADIEAALPSTLKRRSSSRTDLLSEDGESLLSDAAACVQAQTELHEHEQRESQQTPAQRGSRTITTKGGKLPSILQSALSDLKSTVDDDGTLTIARGEQQRVVDTLRKYVDSDDIAAHVAWTIESVIGKVRATFRKVTDSGDNVNVRAIDAMIAGDVMFEVVMRSDGSPTYKLGDDSISDRDVVSAREALKRFEVSA